MKDFHDYKNKKITIMGLGVHGGGLAVAKFLARQGAKVTVTDLKSAQQLSQPIKQLKGYNIRYVLGKHELGDFIHADLVIKNPGVHGYNKFLAAAQKHQVKIETDLSIFFQSCPSDQIIGITGTKGKSTTTSLVYRIMKNYKKDAIIGGNIRISPLDFLAKLKKDTPVVLELSSWQLEGLAPAQISPRFALVTNVMCDHLNTYKGMADYCRAKSYIFKYQKPDDYVVLNKDNHYTRLMARKAKSRIFWYSLKKIAAKENGAYFDQGWLYFKNNDKSEKIIAVADLKIRGEHNLSNVLAAIALARIYNVSGKIIKQTIRQFKSIEGRLELVREVKGVKYYNDTTATTPDAVIAALNSFEQKVVLLAGGTDKKLEFKNLAKAIKTKSRALILFKGTATQKLLKELKRVNFGGQLILVASMAEAFKQAKRILKPKDIFLLSPGAASFGLFNNEFDRGSQFNSAVKKIKA